MKKEKILYIMGIDWTWIYQRPQIIATLLAQDFDVTVLFPRSILKMTSKKTCPAPLRERVLLTLPHQEKNKILEKLSLILNKHLFRDINTFDYVYVGYPLYARYIPSSYRGTIIYDCMDNHEALYPDSNSVSRILYQERHLVQKSKLLFVSSLPLQQKMDALAGYSKSILLRNGTYLTAITPPSPAQCKEFYRLCYIGTLAEWFDFDLVFLSVDVLRNIEYHLVGPATVRYDHPSVIYQGVIPHENLATATRDFDCLIMPFRLNDIVTAVDPVKLYEYIAFGKCIISIYYPELERFRDFVYFYETPDEYISLLRELEMSGFPPKYSEQQQKDFLSRNSWQERYRLLVQKMSNMETINEDKGNECFRHQAGSN